MSLTQTSAKSNTGVEEAFTALAEEVLKIKGGPEQLVGKEKTVQLGNTAGVRPLGGAHDKPGNKCCGK